MYIHVVMRMGQYLRTPGVNKYLICRLSVLKLLF